MLLSDFYARVSLAIRRGTSVDALIPGWTDEAISRLENRRTFAWMRLNGIFPLAAGTSSIPFPSQRAKSFKLLRGFIAGLNPSYTWGGKLRGVDPLELVHMEYGFPQGYYLNGLSTIEFDRIVPCACSVRILWNDFTATGQDPGTSPAILQRNFALLKAETLLVAAQELRDPRLMSTYQAARDEAQIAAYQADDELDSEHQADQAQVYTGFGR